LGEGGWEGECQIHTYVLNSQPIHCATHARKHQHAGDRERAREREREREGQTEDTRKRGGGGERKIDRQRERERERERERGREGAEDYPCRFETLARTRSQLVAIDRGRARWRLIAATFPCL